MNDAVSSFPAEDDQLVHRASVGSAQDWTSRYATCFLADRSLRERITVEIRRRSPRMKRMTKAALAPLGPRFLPKK